jgi:hypothetical protein
MPSRDLGLDHGAGKGDAPRNMSAKFYANFGEIQWDLTRPDMEQRGRKLVKRYGGAK